MSVMISPQACQVLQTMDQRFRAEQIVIEHQEGNRLWCDYDKNGIGTAVVSKGIPRCLRPERKPMFQAIHRILFLAEEDMGRGVWGKDPEIRYTVYPDGLHLNLNLNIFCRENCQVQRIGHGLFHGNDGTPQGIVSKFWWEDYSDDEYKVREYPLDRWLVAADMYYLSYVNMSIVRVNRDIDNLKARKRHLVL